MLLVVRNSYAVRRQVISPIGGEETETRVRPYTIDIHKNKEESVGQEDKM